MKKYYDERGQNDQDLDEFEDLLSNIRKEDWSLQDGVVPHEARPHQRTQQTRCGVLSQKETCNYLVPDVISSFRPNH